MSPGDVAIPSTDLAHVVGAGPYEAGAATVFQWLTVGDVAAMRKGYGWWDRIQFNRGRNAQLERLGL